MGIRPESWSRRSKVSNKGPMSYQKTRMAQSESRHIHFSARQQRSDKCTALQADVPDVPLAVVEEILLNLPAHQVVRVCRLVCREWKELVDSASHWRERCRREGIQPCDASRTPGDWRLFYFLTKKQCNLLKNPCADDYLQGWEIVRNEGDGWVVEGNRKPFSDNRVTKCFVTSYGFCLKRQLIDLKKEGYNAAFMDQLQPHIKISDWYAPRFDCGCQYQICVELLDEKEKTISTFEPEQVLFEQWNDEPWCQMTHVFKDYGRGVRFISFTHGGKDTQFWAGHYGIRVTNSNVEICPSVQR
ncbi:F-box only protein 6-like isoform X1 [Chanodichthys erythropterus]|uniref:F-box only protein 6-like isoform X1 n=1 Tax=Chanodichthys erythropterus TaxID=933992 RepID=UPI00351E44E6